MARLLARLGSLSHRHRSAVVALWLVVLIGGGVGAATLGGQTSDSFAIPGQESTQALERIEEQFSGGGGGATARVVVLSEDGQPLTTPEKAAELQQLVATLGGLPGVVAASDPLDPAAPTVNAAQSAAYSTVTYDAGVGEVTAPERDALLAAVEDAGATGLTVEVTGEAVTAPPHIGGLAEVVGVAVALLVLAVTYGTLATAGMNLLTALVGVGIGVLGVTIATGFGDLSSTTPTLAAMLGLAVGIDYALFIVTRFRQELVRTGDVGTALSTAVGTAGSAVVAAGLTVVIALSGLAVVGIPFLTQMGVAAAATVVVAVLVALTLVPAALSFLGQRALPRAQRTTAAGTSAGPRHGRAFLPG